MWRTLALAVVFALAAPHASAQTQTALISTLEAQFRAATIREHRDAQAREVRLIARAENDMRLARQALAEAGANRAQATARLEQARASYVRIVNDVDLQDSIANIQIEAFRAEVTGALAQASPDLIAAYQEFADGDRASAWPVLETLLRARAAARAAAARAVSAAEIRQLANLHEIMRANGEATTAAVLTLWDQAAELDPRDFWTHIYRARLTADLSQWDRSVAAGRAAQNVATGDREPGLARVELARVLVRRGDDAAALREFQVALDSARRRAQSGRVTVEILHDLLLIETDVGRLHQRQGNLREARRSFEQGLRVSRVLAERDPNEIDGLDVVVIALDSHSAVLEESGDLNGAYSARVEQVQIARRLMGMAPDAVESRLRLGDALDGLGLLLMKTNNYSEAERQFREMLTLTEPLLNTNADGADSRRFVALALSRLGDARMWHQDVEGAAAYYERGLVLSRELAAMTNGAYREQRDYEVALARLGEIRTLRRDYDGARRYFAQAMEGIEGRLAADPNSLADIRDKAAITQMTANSYFLAGDRTRAEQLARASLALQQQAWRAAPDSETNRLDVFSAMLNVALISRAPADRQRAMDFAAQMRRDGVFGPLHQQRLDWFEQMLRQPPPGAQ